MARIARTYLLAIFITLVMGVLLSGCTSSQPGTTTTTAATSIPTTSIPTTTMSMTVAPTTAGTSAAATTVSSGTGPTVQVALTAQNIQFDKSTITVPAGSNVVINFDNMDAGIPHNFALYTDTTASTNLYRGAIITGPSKTTYTFTAPAKPGNYFFRCDVHPTVMYGTFVVT